MQLKDISTCSFNPYSGLVYKAYEKLEKIKCLKHVKIDGENLDIPSVVAISRYDPSSENPCIGGYDSYPSVTADTMSHLSLTTVKISVGASMPV